MPRPIAYLLAESAISDDPRVRRVGDLLAGDGWEVIGIGLPGGRTPQPDWPIVTTALAAENGHHHQPALRPAGPVWRGMAHALAGAAAPGPAALKLASPALAALVEKARVQMRDDPLWPARQRARLQHSLHDARRALLRMGRPEAGTPDSFDFDRFYAVFPHLRAIESIACAQNRPGLWIANDWRTLPIASAARDRIGGAIVYDSHEFAVEEHAERVEWRLAIQPIAKRVERAFIGSAAAVVTVSPAITQALVRRYGLRQPVETIRNTPRYQPTPLRATGAAIEVLYHGIVAPGRGLEAAIMSVRDWRAEYRLVIRGPAVQAGYAESLEKLIADNGLGARVRLDPPVAMTALVAAAAESDIGLMALPGHSLHNRYALPNKLFEYMMAGLALAVSDLPEMSALMAQTGAGATFSEVSPAAIAACVNRLTPPQIDIHKRRALDAAKIYNWSVEGGRMLDLLRRIAQPGTGHSGAAE